MIGYVAHTRGFHHDVSPSKGRCNLECLLFDQGDGLSKEVWGGREWKPKLWLRGCRLLFIKKSNVDKILVVRLEGLSRARNEVDAPSSFVPRGWPLEASHYGCPR